MNGSKLSIAIAFLALGASTLFAHSAGAPAGVSGAPGDGTCVLCHGGTPNSGPGKVALSFSGGSSYSPGQTQHVTVTISDPAAARWGFEASPRLSSDPGNSGAGTLASVDANTQVLPASGTLDWITHTRAGTRPGTSNSITFTFDWTAPSSDVGPVDFYVAANAANGDGTNNGDLIYTSKATLTAATPVSSKPVIRANGVVNGASFAGAISPGSWFTVFGSNFAGSSRIWDPQKEIINGRLPTALDGISVTVNGKPAAVYFISPGQINAQAPDDNTAGPVNIVVTTPAGQSDPATVMLQPMAPALFLFDPQNRRYAAAVAAAGTFLGPSGLFGTAVNTRPANAGETIMLFGTGFGAVSPAVPSGMVFNGAANLVNNVTVTIGGMPAAVAFAGMSGPGLDQLNVTIPAGVSAGDQPVVINLNGIQTPDQVFLNVTGQSGKAASGGAGAPR